MNGYIKSLIDRIAVIDRMYGGPARVYEDERGRLVIDSKKGNWRFFFTPAPADEIELRPSTAGAKEETLALVTEPEPPIVPEAAPTPEPDKSRRGRKAEGL